MQFFRILYSIYFTIEWQLFCSSIIIASIANIVCSAFGQKFASLSIVNNFKAQFVFNAGDEGDNWVISCVLDFG